MAPRGHELVIGMVNDPTFGPIMMVGFGGTMVELMGDVVHRPAPVDVAEATDMLRSLKSARLLAGFRGAAADRHHTGGRTDRRSVAGGAGVS